MARQTLTAVTPASILAGAISANALDVAWVAADATNKEEVVLTGNEILLVWNTHATNPYTFTINTTADDHGRTQDVGPYSLAAGEFACFGFIPVKGFAQTNGKLYFEAENAAVKYLILKPRCSPHYK